ncbi:hypothetical protein VTO42DRAFT_5929 [Malbranchea cinnamomea]
MKLYLQFITTPTSDTPGTTILLHFDEKRYLIGNISEGTQRACVERGLRLSRVSDVFFTGKTEWANNGGVLGLLLTLADAMISSTQSSIDAEHQKIEKLEHKAEWAGKDSPAAQEIQDKIQKYRDNISKITEAALRSAAMNLHGAPNLARTLATARTFVCRKGMPISIQEFGDDADVDGSKDLSEPTWSDEHIKVWAMPISPITSAVSSPKNGSKRTFNEYQESDSVGVPARSDQAALRRQGRAACQHVVSEMFNSDWRPDVLEEMPLSEVPMPATLFVRNTETGKIEEYTGPKPGDGATLPDIKVLVRKPWPGAVIGSLPPTSPSPCAMSYIFRSHDLRGRFDPNKAKELNVRKGPDFKLLTEGQPVTSLDGKTVTPEMVLGPPRPGRGFAVLELPTVDYVQPLIHRPEWNSQEATKGLEIIVWILGPGVGDNVHLQEFMKNMKQCRHIVSSQDYCANKLVFQGVSTTTTHFAQIDEERYQVPFHDNRSLAPPMSNQQTQLDIQTAETGLTIELEPKFKVVLDKAQEAPLDVESIKKGVHAHILREAGEIRRQLKSAPFKERLDKMKRTIPGGDAEIITLGTGSSLPSRYRNVAGTLLRVPGQGSYLFDCGEGTLGQLKRVLGPSELEEVLRDLKLIWISHLHADHHLGIVSIIKAWYRAVFGSDPPPLSGPETEHNVSKVLSERRLFVVSAGHMLQWLGEYACVENYGYNKIVPLLASSRSSADGNISSFFFYNPVDSNGQMIRNSSGQPSGTRLTFEPADSLTPLLQKATGLAALRSVPVPHCTGARAATLVFPSGFSISYSGDCRPSPAFTKIGQDSTVLLHEATFDDEMIKDAIAKRHSTVSEALMVGQRMRAKIVVLTHFSQRYREMSVIDRNKVKFARFDEQRPRGGRGAGVSEVEAIAPAVRDIPATDGTEENDGVGTAGFAASIPATGGQELSPDVPVVLSFDYMRLRVDEALKAEAYIPALRMYLTTSDADLA